MSILVRPVREQLEHDRVIRLLQAKWKKKYDVEINVGDERTASLKVGQLTVFPDLILYSPNPPRRLQGVVEVETGESVNHLEAMAQWTHMSRARAPFQLYVPTNSIDQARRLCAHQQVALAELWSFFVYGEQVRLALVDRDERLAEIPQPPKGSAVEGGRSQAAGTKAAKTASAAGKRSPAKAAAAKPAAAKPSRAKAPTARPAGKSTPPVRRGRSVLSKASSAKASARQTASKPEARKGSAKAPAKGRPVRSTKAARTQPASGGARAAKKPVKASRPASRTKKTARR